MVPEENVDTGISSASPRARVKFGRNTGCAHLRMQLFVLRDSIFVNADNFTNYTEYFTESDTCKTRMSIYAGAPRCS